MTDPKVPLVPMHRDSLHPGLNSVVGYADLVRDSLKRSCRGAMRSVPPALAGGIKRNSTEMRTCSTHPLTRMVLTPLLVRLLRQSPQAGSCEGVVKSCELIRGTVIRCECETGLDVFFLQIGEVCEDLFFTHSASKIFEYVRHGHARSANRRFAAALSRLDRDDLAIIHAGIITKPSHLARRTHHIKHLTSPLPRRGKDSRLDRKSGVW